MAPMGRGRMKVGSSRRRPAAERLADELAALSLVGLAMRARKGEFGDYSSPHPFPKSKIVADLRDFMHKHRHDERNPRITALADRIMDGHFDD